MPVQRTVSRPISSTAHNTRKSMGFSINDIIQKDESTTKFKNSPRHPPVNVLPTFLPQSHWLPPSIPSAAAMDPLVQYQLQYLRNSSRLFDSRFASPEAAAALILHSFRKPKRVRTAFTPAQLLKLENAFEKNHYVVGQERKELARHLNLTETQVKVWYQNRRTKHKRLKSEDGQNSSNDINDEDQHDRSLEGEDDDEEDDDDDDDDDQRRPNQSDTSDQVSKTDDEHSWDPNNNSNNNNNINNNNIHSNNHMNNNNSLVNTNSYSFLSQSSTPRSSISDRSYSNLTPANSNVTKISSLEDHR